MGNARKPTKSPRRYPWTPAVKPPTPSIPTMRSMPTMRTMSTPATPVAGQRKKGFTFATITPSSTYQSNLQPVPPQRRFAFIRRFGWWWEVGAIALSLTSMALILAILFTMNGRPLASWHLPIQINSLVAVFSTFAKSAFLLALSEGVSQLKWNYFEKQGGTLDHLQTFDQASRGPWGALVFPFKIWRGRTGLLAVMGAVLTLFALGFEPFTQQIIDFPSRSVVMLNETAYTPSATDFTLPIVPDTYRRNIPQHALQKAWYSSLPEEEKSRFVCANGDCRIPEHWSLALCKECDEEIVLDDVALGCNYTYRPYNNAFRLNGNLQEFKEQVKAYNGANYSESYVTCFTQRLLENVSFITYPEESVPFVTRFPRWASQIPFIYNNSQSAYTDSNGVLANKSTTDTIILVNDGSCPTIMPLYEDLEDWEGMKTITRNCRVSFCAKRTRTVDISRGVFKADESTVPLDISGSKCNSTDCLQDGVRPLGLDGPIFKVDSNARVIFAGLLDTTLVKGEMSNNFSANSTTMEMLDQMTMVADIFLRSEQNLNATKTYGEAFGQETYVRVRWAWAVFPLVIVVGSVVFLLLTILASLGGEQLYKTSVLAGYFHRLEGWNQAELDRIENGLWRRTERRDRFDQLARKAQEMKVRLWRNTKGELEFIRQR
ncbi:hypothetical protein K505DRAFT_279589 [Melanomma pulvis-pyrius CBS 109.77]|uniref:Uncharacterized protein n=1 Tax=Melanomma pulvis-pyrius CBS 109.77 TaxID=1314802 RepID=A0A6A6X6Y2_9PLEO|nr:hypothetical protein K505DRAFT_279589 [Melanomma pulvis-pyrius CBS 109.77]